MYVWLGAGFERAEVFDEVAILGDICGSSLRSAVFTLKDVTTPKTRGKEYNHSLWTLMLSSFILRMPTGSEVGKGRMFPGESEVAYR
jgi:hypothetical protein